MEEAGCNSLALMSGIMDLKPGIMDLSKYSAVVSWCGWKGGMGVAINGSAPGSALSLCVLAPACFSVSQFS